MPAFDSFLEYSSVEKFKDFRQSLVSHKRGTLSSGNFGVNMSLTFKDENTTLFEDDDSKQPVKLFQRVGKMQQPGFVFDIDGTERAIEVVSNNGKIKLNEDFIDLLKFVDDSKKEQWHKAAQKDKKKCVSLNVQELLKKTDVNYRTHGDRLHYLVIGLVTVKVRNEVNQYPLFLFSCSDMDKATLQVEVESSGFANFWLDKYLLEDLLMNTLKSYEISLDESFATKLNDIARKINALQTMSIDSIECDTTYSSISIVTGFEAEYIDPVWNKILTA